MSTRLRIRYGAAGEQSMKRERKRQGKRDRESVISES
jgi:hypothetical protein